MLAFEGDGSRAACRNRFANGGDFAVADQDLAGGKGFAGDGVDGGAGEEEGLSGHRCRQ